MGIPESLEEAVAKQLTEVFNEAGDFVDEKKFFENVLSHVADTDEYKDLLRKITPSLKVEFEIIGSEKIKETSAEFLTKLISKVCSEFDSHDVRKQDIMDFIDFLRIDFENCGYLFLNLLNVRTDSYFTFKYDPITNIIHLVFPSTRQDD